MKSRQIVRGHCLMAAAGVILMTLAAVQPAAAASFSYTGTLQIASGSYIFNQTTSSFVFLNGFSLSSGSFFLAANIPLIYKNTPYISYSGVGMLPSGGPLSSTVSSAVNRRQGRTKIILPEPETLTYNYRQFGIGDPLLFMGIQLWKENSIIPAVQVAVQAKVPQASLESGFGTGQWDYSAGLSLSKKVGGIFAFADLYYWNLGDLPELALKEMLSYSLSLGIPLSRGKTILMASYSGYTEIISGVEPPSSLSLGLSFRIGFKSSLMLGALFGLSESSPNFAFSAGWIIGF